jgi:hypothetical protein
MMFADTLIPLDSLKSSPDSSILLLTLKNDLIGCLDRKELYFDQGLLETLLPMITD